MRRRALTEPGFTLIELIVAMSMLMAVLAIAVPLMTTSMRSEPELREKAANVQTARVVLDRLTREIREGVSVVTSTPSTFAFRTYTRRSTCGGTAILPSGAPPMLCRVTYACASTTCTRSEAREDGSAPGPAVQFITGLQSSGIFTYTPAADPTFVQVSLVLPNPDGTGNLTIRDGATLRNATLSN